MLLRVEEPSPMSGNTAMFGTQPRNRTHQKTRRFSGFPFTSQRPYGGVHKKLGSPRSPIARATTLPTRSYFGLCKELRGPFSHTTCLQANLQSYDHHLLTLALATSRAMLLAPRAMLFIFDAAFSDSLWAFHLACLARGMSHAYGEDMRLLAGHCET